MMEWIPNLLFALLPSIVVFLSMFWLVKRYFSNEEKLRNYELRKSLVQTTLPLRLQAYERMILFLERISPEHIIPRVQKSGMSAIQLQTTLLKAIREEFEHNLAQQMYVSNEAWSIVKRSKEETIKLINVASSRVNNSHTAMELSKQILGISSNVDRLPTQVAIEFLKNEVKSILA